LQQLLVETPASTEQVELIVHLDHCAACRKLLEQLTDADPRVLEAAGAVRQDTYAQEAPLRRLVDSLGANADLITLYRPQERIAWGQSLLRPAASAESIGPLEDYEVKDVLGQGGMGWVFKAHEPALKRWVAIKVLAPSLASDQVARMRFAREAQAAAAVRHEHVITIYAVREANGLPYFVMEYVAGGSLQDYLDRQEPPDWHVIARLGAEVASGLAAAHARGLVHRDVKPSNILLQSDGVPGTLGAAKISDFGLARAADDSRLTHAGLLAGTPMYMAPEQARGEAVDARADLFSLGSVLYTLCTGREPFPGGSPVVILRHVCDTTPAPIRTLNPAVPDWLAATVERLQAKSPADRFASAADVAELLRYNLEHPDRPRFIPRPRRRRRRLMMAFVAALLLAGGLGVSESMRWTHLTPWGASGDAQHTALPLRATLRGHKGPVWSVAYAPDGKTLVTGSDDMTLRFWDAVTGEPKGSLSGNGGAVFAVAFSHEGSLLVGGSGDGTIRLWDVATRKEKSSLPHRNGNVRRLAISRDDLLAVLDASTQGVEVWNLNTLKMLQTLPMHEGTLTALAFAPDGQTLATGDASSGNVRLWNPTTGELRSTFRVDPFGLRALALAPDGKTMASTGTTDRDVKLWDVTTHKQIATLSGHDNDVLRMVFCPSHNLLATGSRDGIVIVWNMATAHAVATLHAHQGAVWGLAFSPDGRALATVGEDRLGKVWDVGGLIDSHP
jgi:serine/threonine protein kinase